MMGSTASLVHFLLVLLESSIPKVVFVVFLVLFFRFEECFAIPIVFGFDVSGVIYHHFYS
ncbi:hypothetical protein CC78DRAFT_531268 [Lojkania enalia]|uniref:Uncharacterized protein n=1 Tax=Lojkania enalia TaxID=147567 RepID=A0A9P4KIA4_9PLEO|nr:hypothetical protein CC78DRAFT_531268 [Didymosphaeria enalia]